MCEGICVSERERELTFVWPDRDRQERKTYKRQGLLYLTSICSEENNEYCMPCYCVFIPREKGEVQWGECVSWPIPHHALLHWHSANLYTCANEREARQGSCVFSILLRVV